MSFDPRLGMVMALNAMLHQLASDLADALVAERNGEEHYFTDNVLDATLGFLQHSMPPMLAQISESAGSEEGPMSDAPPTPKTPVRRPN